MAVERTMKTALSEEDYNLWDEGKRPVKVPAPVHPEPKLQKAGKILSLDKIKLDKVSLAVTGRRNIKQNKDGVRFIGFNVALQMKEGKDVEGWMPEADYIEMRRILFRDGAVNVDNLEY